MVDINQGGECSLEPAAACIESKGGLERTEAIKDGWMPKGNAVERKGRPLQAESVIRGWIWCHTGTHLTFPFTYSTRVCTPLTPVNGMLASPISPSIQGLFALTISSEKYQYYI